MGTAAKKLRDIPNDSDQNALMHMNGHYGVTSDG